MADTADKTTVSIVTPVRNGEKTLARTIESVLRQTRPVTEYFIIDGVSTDGTVELAETYRSKFEQAGVRFFVVSEPDEGIYDAMNRGIRRTTGELVGIINADDWYEPEIVAVMTELYAGTRFDMAYADIRMHNGGGTFIKRASNPRFVSSRYWNHPTQFVRRAIYEQKLYDNTNVFGDLDFLLWIHRQNAHIEFVNRTLANFTMGGASNNRKSWREVRERIGMKQEIYRRYHYPFPYMIDVALVEIAKKLLGKTGGDA